MTIVKSTDPHFKSFLPGAEVSRFYLPDKQHLLMLPAGTEHWGLPGGNSGLADHRRNGSPQAVDGQSPSRKALVLFCERF